MGNNWQKSFFTIENWAAARALWEREPGMGLSVSDSQEGIGRFLERNPGLSLLAWDGPRLIATAMAGHDGRRGYLYHVCVDASWRGRGVGSALVQDCLDRLKEAGIAKVSLFCKRDNPRGLAYWEGLGWRRRDDLSAFSFDLL